MVVSFVVAGGHQTRHNIKMRKLSKLYDCFRVIQKLLNYSYVKPNISGSTKHFYKFVVY